MQNKFCVDINTRELVKVTLTKEVSIYNDIQFEIPYTGFVFRLRDTAGFLDIETWKLSNIEGRSLIQLSEKDQRLCDAMFNMAQRRIEREKSRTKEHKLTY